ncbi:CAP domain-containing protein [Kitasatospora camelliae]|uniref:CAP domain-containing protein n=1 Tax=Kitasatospora camelliae TaxID=3156397 RepID=A0AAU8K7C3_9ACTN
MAVALAMAVGTPSVAFACDQWSGGWGRQDRGHARATDQVRPVAWSTSTGRWDSASPRWQASPSASASATATATPTEAAPAPASPAPAGTAAAAVPTKAPSPTASQTPASRSATRTATPTPAAPTTAAPTTAAPAGSGLSAAASRVLALVNTERQKAGCGPVTANAKLTAAAQAHSQDMAAHATMTHTGSDGSTAGDRITRAGYAWSTYGENVAYGYSTPEAVMNGWMTSPGHKANILNCAFKEIGIGLAQPGNYWTQDFGTSR